MFSVPYTHHFGLKANPFSAVPDPRFLYMSAQHKEALAHLLYGLGTDGGIVLLTGEAGSGKTTICRCLLAELPRDIDVASIDEPDLTVEALVASACRAFGVAGEGQGSVKRHVDRLNTFLLANHARGHRSVLMVDEAQRLSIDVLEQLRLLTNLETHERKLLQVLLIGGPELRDKLARSELRQLSQRIVARFHIRPLRRAEVAEYVQHRLALAGGRPDILPLQLAGRLHALSQGIPRRINQLCDRALLDASTHGQDQVNGAGLSRAAQALGMAGGARRMGWLQPSWAVAAAGAVSALAGAVTITSLDAHPAAPAGTPAAPAAPSVVSTAEAAPAIAPVSAMPEAAASMPVPAGQLAWPEPAQRERSATVAYGGLLQRWGATGPRGAAPCAAPLPDQLRCLQGRGGLAALREMNLPAVLHLTDDHGRAVDALLTSVDDEAVSLAIGGAEQRLARDALAASWQGGYTLLWRAPPAFGDVLRPGSRGPAVAWLRTRLAQWRGEPVPAQPERPFDDELLLTLRQFQLAEGLDPDGAAGVKTLTRLAALTDPSMPTLAAAGR